MIGWPSNLFDRIVFQGIPRSLMQWTIDIVQNQWLTIVDQERIFPCSQRRIRIRRKWTAQSKHTRKKSSTLRAFSFFIRISKCMRKGEIIRRKGWIVVFHHFWIRFVTIRKLWLFASIFELGICYMVQWNLTHWIGGLCEVFWSPKIITDEYQMENQNNKPLCV